MAGISEGGFKILSKTPFQLALIALLGLIAYSNTFDVPFQWDDRYFVERNPVLTEINYFLSPSDAEKFGEIYTSLKTRYIGYLTFALNYKLHGLDVRGYHIFNLAVHILNAMLVYWLVALTFRTPFLTPQPLPSPSRGEGEGGGAHRSTTPPLYHTNFIALFSALLFVSHPIQTEAVTYIFQRFASLVAFFYLMSVVFYVKWRLASEQRNGETATRPPFNPLRAKEGTGEVAHSPRHPFALSPIYIFYLASLLSAILAMKTKENAFTLPVVIALYEFFFFAGPVKRRVLYLVPIMLTMFIIPLTLIGVDKPLGEIIGDVSKTTKAQTEMARLTYLFTQFRVIVTYIRLLFLPVNQNLDYDYPILDSFLDPEVFLSFLFLSLILGVAVYLFYRSRFHSELRLVSFGIFWFLITLSVESSIIPIVDVIFEHRVYLPSANAFMVLTACAFIFAEKVNYRRMRTITVLLLSLATLALSGMTYARNIVWQNEITLWEDVVGKSPEKARVHNNLGDIYYYKGLIDKAEEHYLIALKLRPDYAIAHNNIGAVYFSKGLIDRAIEHYRIALNFRPDIAEAHFNLGVAYLGKGVVDKARTEFHLALQINPAYHQAQKMLRKIDSTHPKLF